ncbi:flagellar basal body rod protein FlgF [Moritella sp.]|uniref:flagellar basal body rod protein FlgF n=1 Tax=Moritella sp. TaxID=78556 RepID=UPI0025D481D0|nr:flagellar basal body rod protein FlgF [Moritella sp.]
MKLLYTALSGAEQSQTAMNIRANNLANVNTNGFKADIDRAVAYKIEGVGYETRYLSQSAASGTNFAAGELEKTGRSLDIAIQGEGYIAVQTPGGAEAYTRAGSMTLDSEGRAFINGNAVVADGAQLTFPEYQSIEIGSDGTVTAITLGGAQIQVGLIKLIKPEAGSMVKGQDGLLHLKTGAVGNQAEDVALVSGFLEGSNVNAVTELVASMMVNRQFELQIKMMKTADTLAQKGNQLING